MDYMQVLINFSEVHISQGLLDKTALSIYRIQCLYLYRICM